MRLRGKISKAETGLWLCNILADKGKAGRVDGRREVTVASGDSGPGKLVRLLNYSVRRKMWIFHTI